MTAATAQGAPVIDLAEPAAAHVAVAGGKAAALSRLMAAGFPVPGGVVLTAAVCGQIVSEGYQLQPQVRSELTAAIARLGSGPFAVRSSALTEDSAAASYAGQYRSVLGVSNAIDDVCAAVATVLKSASGQAHLDAYRARFDATDTTGIAVVVQQQLAPDAAGVAFTADPVTGDRDRTIINAVRGLADRLVNGEVTPQQWLVRDGVATCTAYGDDSGDGEGPVSEREAIVVAALAARVEARFGVPQDIEWAIVDGTVQLLQARPMTALPVPPAVDLPAGSWIKESGRRAELMTPFGASAVLPIVSEGLSTAFAATGSLVERIEMHSVAGQVYLRIVPVGGERAARGNPPPWWLLGVLSRVVPSLRARCRVARHAIDDATVDDVVNRWSNEWRPQILEESARLRAVDIATMSDVELREHLDAAVGLTGRGLDTHFRLLPPYALTLYNLITACRDVLGWEFGRSLTLLSGTSIVTSEPTRALAAVAALVADPVAVREVLEDAHDVVERLIAVDEKVGAAFEAWCDTYAWRVLGEDPGAPTLAEQPGLLASLLRDELTRLSGSNVDVNNDRAFALDQARAVLAKCSATDREQFEHALAAAMRAYPTREDSAVWGACHPAGLVRRALVEAGRRLVAHGSLDRAEDAKYLDIEILRAALGGRCDGLRELVARARAERAWVAAHPGPRFYGSPPGRSPDVRGLPAAARRMNEAMLWTESLQHNRPMPALADGTLQGAPASAGRHTGPVRIVRHFHEFDRVRPGDVLVCRATDPSWSVLFGVVGAIVTEGGGALSHAAIVAREHGVPAVLAVDGATDRLLDGQLVTVDGTAGTVGVADLAQLNNRQSIGSETNLRGE
ncbi:MAG: PEP/pyruvate-binding domain-containing protein [Acidothermaceae bacterium]